MRNQISGLQVNIGAGGMVKGPSARARGRTIHGGSNVVYRRPGGTIGWIDAGPERLARG
jgi:hypothetical protein